MSKTPTWTSEIWRIHPVFYNDWRGVNTSRNDFPTLERADMWWSSLLRTQFEDGAVEVGWDEFVRLFRAMFVPEHIQDKTE
ncbi:hypothetical protein Taro_023565 [Colocasia esculenta]|uniref:Uncharacterized protein n=1 Tax=Colocasia esculenta TaxID=4460 RepID=A0A843VB64_COLES|nr:hypothetical protein [Colocasia esculenta]